jgi:hypothetical protein
MKATDMLDHIRKDAVIEGGVRQFHRMNVTGEDLRLAAHELASLGGGRLGVFDAHGLEAVLDRLEDEFAPAAADFQDPPLQRAAVKGHHPQVVAGGRALHVARQCGFPFDRADEIGMIVDLRQHLIGGLGVHEHERAVAAAADAVPGVGEGVGDAFSRADRTAAMLHAARRDGLTRGKSS